MTADTWRDQITETIHTATLAETGLSAGAYTSGQIADAIMPILHAAVAEARAETARQILHELEVAQARAIPHNDWRTACTNEVRKAFVTCQHIARQYGGEVASDDA